MPKSKQTGKLKRARINSHLGSGPLWVVLLIVAFAISLSLIAKNSTVPIESNYIISTFNKINSGISNLGKDPVLATFKSVDEFNEYLEISIELNQSGFGRGSLQRLDVTSDSLSLAPNSDFKESGGAGRVSTTNVQVVGIDEPDVLKTDGQTLFYSNTARFYGFFGRPVFFEANIAPPVIDIEVENSQVAPPEFEPSPVKTKLVNVWPVDDIALSSEIDLNGKMLLTDDVLTIFTNNGHNIKAYDVSEKAKPTELWTIDLGKNTNFSSARLYNGRIYLVTSTNVNQPTPCPFRPLIVNGQDLTIACTEIYHPISPSRIDSEIVISKVNPQTGAVESNLSFVAESYSTIVYMSPNAIYLAYNQSVSSLDYMINFIQLEATDLIPIDLVIKLNKVNSYDIGPQAKMVEFRELMAEWTNSLDDNTRLKVDNELSNRIAKYNKKNMRKFVRTNIAKVGLSDLKFKAIGSVPGRPLNQFSLDEHNGNLRIATNIDGGNNSFWPVPNVESANDVYVLNSDLNVIGSVKDLGLGERIYSARFVGDMAYLVTFRQIDPFYVLDMSNPRRPTVRGELKIPGFSSYLHPISESRVLGVGKEGSQLKLSYFDVSNPDNPREIDKYTLSEYTSELLYDHHAFLQDPKHNIFFLPGGLGAYIFSYENDKISLVKTLNDTSIKRALYLNDYLYVVGDDALYVYDENTWEKVSDLEFD